MESLEKYYLELLKKQRTLNEKLVSTENEGEMLAIIEEYSKVSEECDEVSHQIGLLEHIEELKKAGAIIMQHKDLLLHKNGAKFPIAKNYIIDGLIKKDQKYTIIFLPE